MIIGSRLTLGASYEKEENSIIRTKVFLVLNEVDEEIIETEDILQLKYDSEKPSRRYHNLDIGGLFEHYLDSYDIKIFKLYETLGYIPNEEVFKTIELKCYDLLDSDDTFKKFRDNNYIDVHLVKANNVEIGYLIKDGSCDVDDLANFYFIDEVTAVWYFGIYFGSGKFPLKNVVDSELENIPKPFDIDILLTHYCKIDDVLFDKSIMLMEFVKIPNEVLKEFDEN